MKIRQVTSDPHKLKKVLENVKGYYALLPDKDVQKDSLSTLTYTPMIARITEGDEKSSQLSEELF